MTSTVILSLLFTPQTLRATWALFSQWHLGGRAGSSKKACLGSISGTMRCKMLIFGQDIDWGM